MTEDIFAYLLTKYIPKTVMARLIFLENFSPWLDLQDLEY